MAAAPSRHTRTGVAKLRLHEFRCFRSLQLGGASCPLLGHTELAKQNAVALVGANGSGKTSILEALSLLSGTRGLRSAASEVLLARNAPPDTQGWCVTAEIQKSQGTPARARTQETQEISVSASPSSARKLYQLHNTPTNAQKLARTLPLLWLTPSHVNLFSGSASLRARFYDRLVVCFFPDHATLLNRATKLRQERRRILTQTAGRLSSRQATWLDSIEAGLADEVIALEARRLATALYLEPPLRLLESPFCRLTLELTSDPQTENPTSLHAHAQHLIQLPREPTDKTAPTHTDTTDTLSDTLRTRLAHTRTQDAQSGRTSVSPSHFDLTAELADEAGAPQPAHTASTGEEKRALLSLLLATTTALATRNTPPLLLLDELVAHLDAQVAERLFAVLATLGTQVWVSGQDPALFPPNHFLRLSLTTTQDNNTRELIRLP